jgi:hypothetical protein
LLIDHSGPHEKREQQNSEIKEEGRVRKPAQLKTLEAAPGKNLPGWRPATQTRRLGLRSWKVSAFAVDRGPTIDDNSGDPWPTTTSYQPQANSVLKTDD